MHMFEELLLAIDNSPASQVATTFTAAFAQRTHAPVHVLHVREHVIGGGGVTLLTREEVTELITNAVLELRAAGVRATGSSVTATHREVPNRIVETAQKRSAGAIVLGSNRRHRLGRLFSPRVRERTTRLTSLLVLTAPSPLEFGRLPLDDVLMSHFVAAQSAPPSSLSRK
jgi:nucleotide-binding universal stress UspA family protein